MNKVCISGRLIKEPTLREFENDNVLTTFFIANDVHFGQNKKTGFFKCQAWGNLGRIINDHARTGTELYITGRLEQHRYENEQGVTVYDNGIQVEQFDFGGRGRSEGPREDVQSTEESAGMQDA